MWVVGVDLHHAGDAGGGGVLGVHLAGGVVPQSTGGEVELFMAGWLRMREADQIRTLTLPTTCSLAFFFTAELERA